jgi:hypothetical protein
MGHQISSVTHPGYVDKRRNGRQDFDTRIVTGPVVYTANAGGTTTTIVGAAAALNTGTNVMRLDDEFKLFNVTTGTLKEETVFRVTAVAAGGTTVTFTPAAAVATVSGDTAKLVGTANLSSNREKDTRLIAIGFPALYVSKLTENDKDFQLRVSDDPGSL